MHVLPQAAGGPGLDPVASEALRRMTAGACASYLLVAPAFLVLWYLAGDPVTSAAIATAMLLAAFTRIALRGGAAPGRLAAVMALAVTATVACGTWRSGGAGTTHATWFLVLPLFGTYLFGAVGCLAVSTLCLLSMTGMWAWQYVWGAPPCRIDPAYAGLFELAHVLGIALAIALVTIHWRRTALYERRQREELKAGFAHAVESMRDAVLVLDGDGAVETANRAGTALLASLPAGPRPLLAWLERATGRRAAELLADADLPGIRHPQDGRHFDALARAWAGRTVLTLHDVSARIAIERELRRASEEAQRANRAKSEFLANLSHEIRTPMSGILGMTELALQAGPDATMADRLLTVQRCGRSMLALLNDVLDLSRIEAGHMELAQEEFDLRAVLDEVRDTLGSSAELAGLELRCHAPADLPGLLLGDPQRVRQVLLNLVGNALKFTEEGAVEVEVKVVRQGSAAALLRISVHDTGIGIPPEELPGLFEKFARGRPSDGRPRGGTGLGLTIAREIVERMGGTLTATSRPGAGSSFHAEIEFPVVDARLPGHGADVLVGRRVLVVDGDADRRRQLARRVRRLGCRYEFGTSAAEALAKLRHAAESGDGYWAVLLCESCPGMAAAEFRAHLQGDPRLAATPVLDYPTAPLRQSDLAARLLALADGIGAARAGATAHGHAPSDAAGPAVAARPADAPPQRVLLVEDNEVNRQLVLAMLERSGCRTVVARNGSEGVEAARGGGFDLVLMDCQMPEMDGYAATRAIRALPGEAGSVPIVALTANAMDGDRDRCLEAGMDDYLAKPLRGAELDAVLRRWMPSADR